MFLILKTVHVQDTHLICLTQTVSWYSSLSHQLSDVTAHSNGETFEVW